MKSPLHNSSINVLSKMDGIPFAEFILTGEAVSKGSSTVSAHTVTALKNRAHATPDLNHIFHLELIGSERFRFDLRASMLIIITISHK